MTLHLPTFFAYARRAPFGGRLTKEQVRGCESIIVAFDGADDRHLAYSLATGFHETAGTMAPVREGSTRTKRLTDAQARAVVAHRRYGKPDPETGHVYYGRALPQLTWKRNYIRIGEALGVDLKNNPDLLLDWDLSARALYIGMRDGIFTTKRLDQFFNATTDDPEGARKIVNGVDKAKLIAGYHRNFLDAIVAARAAGRRLASADAGGIYGAGPHTISAATTEAAKPDGADLKTDKVVIGGVLTGVGALGGMVTYAKPVLESINSPWAFAFAALIAVGVFLVLTGRVQLKVRGGV